LKLEQESDEAVAVSNLSYDTIGAYVEFAEADDQMSDEELVRLINMHDLMLDEDAFQEELLERLSGTSFKPAVVETVRELAQNQGVSNIGISDED